MKINFLTLVLGLVLVTLNSPSAFAQDAILNSSIIAFKDKGDMVGVEVQRLESGRVTVLERTNGGMRPYNFDKDVTVKSIAEAIESNKKARRHSNIFSVGAGVCTSLLVATTTHAVTGSIAATVASAIPSGIFPAILLGHNGYSTFILDPGLQALTLLKNAATTVRGQLETDMAKSTFLAHLRTAIDIGY